MGEVFILEKQIKTPPLLESDLVTRCCILFLLVTVSSQGGTADEHLRPISLTRCNNSATWSSNASSKTLLYNSLCTISTANVTYNATVYTMRRSFRIYKRFQLHLYSK